MKDEGNSSMRQANHRASARALTPADPRRAGRPCRHAPRAGARGWRAPALFRPRSSVFRKLVEQCAALAHDALGDFHLARELGVEGRELDAVGQLGGVEGIALGHAQARQELPGKDDAGRVSDRGDLELHEKIPSRNVITYVNTLPNPGER